jgi:hypothetical protein
MPEKKCKGCERDFVDTRANVKFCLPECALISKRIQFYKMRIQYLERQITMLGEKQEQIRIYGGVLPSVEKQRPYSTGGVDPYHVPDEHF